MDSDRAFPDAGPVPQRHVSGLLVGSLLLSVVGFVLLPLIGPVAGLILAFVGKKKVRDNPTLIGPRLALASVLIGIAAVGTHGVMVFVSLPGLMAQQAIGEKVMGLRASLQERDHEKIHALMSAEWQSEHTVESVKEMIDTAFPGEAAIGEGEEAVRVREEDIDNDAVGARFKAFLDENPSEIEVLFPYAIKAEEGSERALDLTILIRRTGWVKFEVELLDLRIYPLPDKPAEAEKTPLAPTEGEGATNPEDEPGEKPR